MEAGPAAVRALGFDWVCEPRSDRVRVERLEVLLVLVVHINRLERGLRVLGVESEDCLEDQVSHRYFYGRLLDFGGTFGLLSWLLSRLVLRIFLLFVSGLALGGLGWLFSFGLFWGTAACRVV